jgi:hypothetical protein
MVRRISHIVLRLLLALALVSGAVVASPRDIARGGDEPRDQPVGVLQATGETRVVFDQTGTQVWAVVDGWDLDQYLFRDASPLNFAIDVDRDFGPVDADGHPVSGNVLFGLTGRISLRVFDVDDDAPTNPEVDEVYINGYLLGTLTGAND